VKCKQAEQTLSLIAVVTGVRTDRTAGPRNRPYLFFFAVFFAPVLALVDFLAVFLAAMCNDSCHAGFGNLNGNTAGGHSGTRRKWRPIEARFGLPATGSRIRKNSLGQASGGSYMQFRKGRQLQLIELKRVGEPDKFLTRIRGD
jgi:hypothetical protein